MGTIHILFQAKQFFWPAGAGVAAAAAQGRHTMESRHFSSGRTGSAGVQVSSGGHKLAGAGAGGSGQAHWLG